METAKGGGNLISYHKICSWTTVRLAVRTGVIFTAFGLPFRLMEFLNLSPLAGPQNMLAPLFGILFGGAGAVGIAWGVIALNILTGSFSILTVIEFVLMGGSSWASYILWHLPKTSEPPRLKTVKDMLKYILIALFSGSILGVGFAITIQGELLPEILFLQVAVSTLFWSVLLGMPIMITLTSIFHISPALSWRAIDNGGFMNPDLTFTLHNGEEKLLCGITDAIEEFIQNQHIPPKQSYAIMLSVEELSVLILGRLVDGEQLTVMLEHGDNVQIIMRYPGARYNPMAIGIIHKDPIANMDILGILMVREMAVATHYQCRNNWNELKIII